MFIDIFPHPQEENIYTPNSIVLKKTLKLLISKDTQKFLIYNDRLIILDKATLAF